MEPMLNSEIADTPGPVVEGGAAHADTYGTIDDLMVGVDTSDGVAIDSLEFGTRLLVRTRYSQYRLTVLNGETGDVLIEGGNMLHGITPARVNGATAGGSAMKLGWIGIGLRIELSVGGVRVTTSPVRSIEIENDGVSRVFLGGLQ
jgi:hypothetical protein